MLLNNQDVTEEIKLKFKKKPRNKNDSENTTPNLRYAVLRGKFIAIQAYLKKWVKYQINNLTLHLKQLEKEKQKILKLVEGKKS